MNKRAVTLAFTVLWGCVSVRYQRAGEATGRVRFVHEGRANGVDAVPGSAQADTSDPARVAIYGAGDTPIGYLMLGGSTPADAARVLEAHGGLGPARENAVTFRIGSTAMHPHLLYTPPRTMHQLYFDKDTLVLAVSGMPHGLPNTRREFVDHFAQARETRRESGWYELQVHLRNCIWLIAVFSTATDSLDSYAYARPCSH